MRPVWGDAAGPKMGGRGEAPQLHTHGNSKQCAMDSHVDKKGLGQRRGEKFRKNEENRRLKVKSRLGCDRVQYSVVQL